ncbi:MAG TPA: hypothetical protein VK939_08890 [Longimicrobiales bacterium]|nr:hypothetical protein [Longimicrobiales bacterium]
MKRRVGIGIVLALLIAGGACTHRVTRPATPEETLERLAWWPRDMEGVVLRDGREVRLQRSAQFFVEGDSLILKQVPGERGRVFIDTVRIADVTHVMVRKTHVGRTVAAVILIPVGIVLVAALLAEDEPDPPPETSCPFIYAHDGTTYVAVAEPLGGAITAGLKRTDLSQLEGLALVDGAYELVIANEMREVQHIDAFSLLAADHPPGSEVIADRAGNLHVVRPTVAPLRAVSSAGDDLEPALRAHDGEWWSPGGAPAAFQPGHARDTITITFPRPARPAARLVMHARTSRLGAHSLKLMLDLWGGEVDHWYALLDGSSAVRAAHEEWVQREELWVLRVWVREGGEWVPQDVVTGGGPYISELQAVPLDLSRVQGSTVELRLHPARGYWDLDFAALDTAAATAPIVTELHIDEAEPLAGQDTRSLLRSADDAYLVMAETGQRIAVRFRSQPPAAGMTRTLFSRTTGYYRIETDRSGTRQAARLDSLWLHPGYAVRLAEQIHLQARRRQAAR